MTKDLSLERNILSEIKKSYDIVKDPLDCHQIANAICKAMYGKPISTWNRYKIGRHGGSKIKTDQLVTDDQKYLCYQIIDRMFDKGFLKMVGCRYILSGKEV